MTTATELTRKLIANNPALSGVDFASIDILSTLNFGGEIMIAAGRCPAGEAQIVAVIAPGSCHAQGVETAVHIEARSGDRKRAMTNTDAIKFAGMLS